MNLITIILIAFGLSMDAFAVSVTSGATLHKPGKGDALMIGSFFGGFQAFMPIVGWFAGLVIITFISSFDHWLAFGILLVIGGKMVFESLKPNGKNSFSKRSMPLLIMLSVATSIDALAVGLSMSLIGIDIILPVIIIGIMTFSLSFMGIFVGKKFGSILGKRIETIGGAVLILIGIMILAEHIL